MTIVKHGDATNDVWNVATNDVRNDVKNDVTSDVTKDAKNVVSNDTTNNDWHVTNDDTIMYETSFRMTLQKMFQLTLQCFKCHYKWQY